MSTDLTGHPRTSRGTRVRRPAAVLAAVLAALVLWAITTQAVGMNLHSPAFSPTQAPAPLGVGMVAVASGLAGLAAWGLLALLERVTRRQRARRAWTVIAAASLVISLGAPLSGHGISGPNRAVLACLHLLVAAVLITMLSRTTRTQATEPSQVPDTDGQRPILADRS